MPARSDEKIKHFHVQWLIMLREFYQKALHSKPEEEIINLFLVFFNSVSFRLAFCIRYRHLTLAFGHRLWLNTFMANRLEQTRTAIHVSLSLFARMALELLSWNIFLCHENGKMSWVDELNEWTSGWNSDFNEEMERNPVLTIDWSDFNSSFFLLFLLFESARCYHLFSSFVFIAMFAHAFTFHVKLPTELNAMQSGAEEWSSDMSDTIRLSFNLSHHILISSPSSSLASIQRKTNSFTKVHNWMERMEERKRLSHDIWFETDETLIQNSCETATAKIEPYCCHVALPTSVINGKVKHYVEQSATQNVLERWQWNKWTVPLVMAFGAFSIRHSTVGMWLSV